MMLLKIYLNISKQLNLKAYFWRSQPTEDLPELPLPTVSTSNYKVDKTVYCNNPKQAHGGLSLIGLVTKHIDILLHGLLLNTVEAQSITKLNSKIPLH